MSAVDWRCSEHRAGNALLFTVNRSQW